MSPKILYRDSELLIVDKPAKMLVHRTLDPNRPNLEDYLKQKFSVSYLRTVNRLDLETSGIVVFNFCADKNKEIDLVMDSAEKKYLCVVSGVVVEDQFRVESFLKEGKNRMNTVLAGGKKAITDFFVLDRNTKKNYTVLSARLVTGRRHQIRIHISEKGYSILGEKVYSTIKSNIDRCLLHSYQLKVKNLSGQELLIVAEIPEDMKVYILQFMSH